MEREIKVLENIGRANDLIADENRRLLDGHNVFAFNIMGSPGSGKTSLLEASLGELSKTYRIAVIEGDLATRYDAERIRRFGVEVLQVNTGDMCHLEAASVSRALAHFNLDELDLLFVENVGNLVCPAFFDVGAHRNIVVISTPEGDDKPAKYPVMFRNADLLVVNKLDLLPYLEVDLGRIRRDALMVNPRLEIIEASCKTGVGVDSWIEWVRRQLERPRRSLG
ncbi:MAG: hydrogenase nickel incorporation protein HypB [Candidatus Bathyarchaeia archaeon]|nr:hydrogenase nickel incorporation protein HypB [Candidatus Bathyarchaeota archaeon]